MVPDTGAIGIRTERQLAGAERPSTQRNFRIETEPAPISGKGATTASPSVAKSRPFSRSQNPPRG